MQYFCVLIAILFRLLPHPWNMTPMGAIFLFSGATFKNKSESLLFPLAALFLSDAAVNTLLYHNQYAHHFPLFTWLGFMTVGLLGWPLRHRFSWGRMAGCSLAGSVVFFLISNFGVWLDGTLYALTLGGLINCYWAGIPFFTNMLAGDLFYATGLFALYQVLNSAMVYSRAIQK